MIADERNSIDSDEMTATRLRTDSGHTVIESIALDGEWDGSRWLGQLIRLNNARVRRVGIPLEQSMHPAPRRQIGVILSGRLEVEVASGERRSFGAGCIVFLEDTTGTGHITRVLEPSTYLELHLADT